MQAKVSVSNTPKIEAGKQLSELLKQHSSQPILLVLSGDSALTILDHIDVKLLGTHITVVMGDDRFTDQPEGNNYLKLTQTTFFREGVCRGMRTISTASQGYQSYTELAQFLGNSIKHYLGDHDQPYVLGVFGMGDDGHTAGIFPMNESPFVKIYDLEGERYAVPVLWENDTYPERVSITPNIITDKIDQKILFVTGEQKNNLLKEQKTSKIEINKFPVKLLLDDKNTEIFTDQQI